MGGTASTDICAGRLSRTRQGDLCYEGFKVQAYNGPEKDCSLFCSQHCVDWLIFFLRRFPPSVYLRPTHDAFALMTWPVDNVLITFNERTPPNTTIAQVHLVRDKFTAWSSFSVNEWQGGNDYKTLTELSDIVDFSKRLCMTLQNSATPHVMLIRVEYGDKLRPHDDMVAESAPLWDQLQWHGSVPPLYVIEPPPGSPMRAFWWNPGHQQFDAKQGVIVDEFPAITIVPAFVRPPPLAGPTRVAPLTQTPVAPVTSVTSVTSGTVGTPMPFAPGGPLSYVPPLPLLPGLTPSLPPTVPSAPSPVNPVTKPLASAPPPSPSVSTTETVSAGAPPPPPGPPPTLSVGGL